MNSSTFLDFLSKYCKGDKHSECIGKWNGMGIEVSCYCKCHNKEEKQKASGQVGGPSSNASDLPYHRMGSNDDY